MRITVNYSDVIEKGNLLRALGAAVHGKYGKIAVKRFLKEYPFVREYFESGSGDALNKIMGKLINPLHEELANFTWRPGETHEFTLFSGGKDRVITVCPLWADRVVHHAIKDKISEYLRRYYDHCQCSCVPDRGCSGKYGALNLVKKAVRDLAAKGIKRIYCLKTDIRSFYPTIDHAVLKEHLTRLVMDKGLLDLLFKIIDGYHVPYDKEIRNSGPGYGIPIGYFMSPDFGNILLAPVLKRTHDIYGDSVKVINYADDTVFLAGNKKRLRNILHNIYGPYIENDLHQSLNYHTQIFPVGNNPRDKSGRPLNFVGYKFYRNCAHLRNNNKRAFKKRCSAFRSLPERGLRAYKIFMAPYLGWIKDTDSRNLFRKHSGIEFWRILDKKRVSKKN